VGWIGPGVAVLDEDVSPLEIREHALVEPIKFLRRKGAIDLSPPDLILAGGLSDDKLIIGRTARVITRSDDEGPQMDEDPFSPSHYLFIKSGGGEVPIRTIHISDAMDFESAVPRDSAKLFHGMYPFAIRDPESDPAFWAHNCRWEWGGILI
jgi:hypothetical protein